MIVPLVFDILVAGLIVFAVVKLARSRSDQAMTAESVGRFLEYALLLILVGIVAFGVAGLLEAVLAAGDELARTDESAVARSLAFLVVGAPALAWLSSRVLRRVQADAEQRAALGWAAYLTVTQLVALVTAMFATARVLRWAFGEAAYDAAALASAIVGSVVWAGHWIAGQRLCVREHLMIGRLAASAVGLVGSATAAGFGLGWLLATAYDEAFRSVLASAPADELRVAAAWLVVALPVWWWHWLRHARDSAPTTAWKAYVLLIGVLGAVLTAAVAVGTTAFVLFQWIVGDPDPAAADQFAPVAGAVAGLVTGLAVWAYHRAALAPLRPDRTELDRTYGYLLAVVGLAGAAAGVAVVLAALIDALLPESSGVVGSGAGDALAAGLTLLVVGGPVWARQWWRAEQHAAADPAGERSSGTRRTYLYAVIAVSGLASLIGLIGALVVGIEDTLEGALGVETVRQVHAALATLVVAGGVTGYHAGVVRRDRALAPRQAHPGVRDVLLVSADGADLADALSRELGADVRTLRRVEPAAAPTRVDDVVADLRAETHEHVVLVVTPDGRYEVVPVERRL